MAIVILAKAMVVNVTASDKMHPLNVRRSVGRRARNAIRAAAGWGRRLGLLPYAPEQRSVAAWTAAYEAGQLEYYGELDELARYSVLVGYVGWAARVREEPPSVLDIGCGVGLLRQLLEGATWKKYVGVDVSEAAISVARAGAFERSRFVVGDALTLDVGRFDIVVLNEVLYYASDPRAFLEHLRSCLTVDGVVLLSVWRHPGDRRLWRLVDEIFPIVDQVEVRDRANRINRRGWKVACCRATAIWPPAGGTPISRA